jgi:polygalacturonase
VQDCTLAGGDDNVAVKSGRGAAGRAFNQSSHHITLRNLTLLHGLGVTVGAESAGGVHDIHVQGLTALNTLTAVHVQSPRWLEIIAVEFEPARILHLAVLPHECLPAVLEL